MQEQPTTTIGSRAEFIQEIYTERPDIAEFVIEAGVDQVLAEQLIFTGFGKWWCVYAERFEAAGRYRDGLKAAEADLIDQGVTGETIVTLNNLVGSMFRTQTN